ncbi:MAG: SAM-dependent chlorinase/fluorinase [Gammaproteobacteria bacterium]|nr:SAM-dependent chlorinase/fluorinase [Gammaproteobacteria bacterium]
MIVLFTDFGLADPYVGQMHTVLSRETPNIPVINLLHTVPDFDIRAGAYLLPALAADYPRSTVFVGVIDPGVGGDRAAVMMKADCRWYVGPDNGLFHIIARRAQRKDVWMINWRPERLSTSFHGRDLFAPIAAKLARGDWPDCVPAELTQPSGDWPDDLPAVVYIDHYGNVITGLRASTLARHAALIVGGRRLRFAEVFTAVPVGEPFWYENSNGLVEIATNRASAAKLLRVAVGDQVTISQS